MTIYLQPPSLLSQQTHPMGRKSKRPAGSESTAPSKPSCYYCIRQFDNEQALIEHQKLVHFKCLSCSKRFGNAGALNVHMKAMHDSVLTTILKAEPGRDDPTLNIVGSSGVPSPEETEAYAKKRAKLAEIESLIGNAAAVAAGSQVPLEDGEVNADGSVAPAFGVGLPKGLVYADESTSPEEQRAKLPRYRAEETSLSERLNLIGATIENKAKELAARAKVV